MRRLILGALLFVPGPAFAVPKVEQQRAMHVPYVRTLTECYAGKIRADEKTLALASKNNWSAAVGEVWGHCRREAAEMIESHDRIFGHGTGKRFFNGPYAKDLPRALTERLQADIQDWRSRSWTEGLRLKREASGKYNNCLDSEVSRINTSSETAPKILAANVVSKCTRYEPEMIQLYMQYDLLSKDEAMRKVHEQVRGSRMKVFADVMRVTGGTTATERASPEPLRPNLMPSRTQR